jgi:hypothetical protein
MCLPTLNVTHFYSIWKPLLIFVNEQYEIAPDLLGARPDGQNIQFDTADAIELRNKLWEDETLLDKFIVQNPANLRDTDLEMAKTWKHRRLGDFIIYKCLKNHAIFLNWDNSTEVFYVKGLASSFDEIFPYFPIMIVTGLLPYGDQIITDGLFQSYGVSFGKGIRTHMKSSYDDAKERDNIITSLLPSAPLTHAELIEKAETINKKVLANFEKHLYKSGVSPKVVERDVATIIDFATYLLEVPNQPHSLYEIEETDLLVYHTNLPGTTQKTAVTGFKRFFKFMRDTERMDWAEVDNYLSLLKSM